MQKIIHLQQTHQTQHTNSSLSFIPPEQLLQGLLSIDINTCTCTQQKLTQSHQQQSISLDNIQTIILNLQQTLDSMNHQVIQVESLLTQRDTLYHQLDHLRSQRQQIQDQLQTQQHYTHQTIKIKSSRGLKQMNQRLKRRISEVRQYIDKMDTQNLKIQQSMTISQYAYSPTKKIHSYTQYRGPSNPTWLDTINSQKSYKKLTNNYYDGLRKRLQMKQQQAWQRVKKQQQGIQNRNARSLMNFNRIGMKSGYINSNYRPAY